MSEVVVRFAGDSGDGIQLTGTQFTSSTALFGNDLSVLPDFPAEIRAPAGTMPGVSGFQIRLSSVDIHTPGDEADLLVAMNPAALRASLGDVRPGGVILANSDAFTQRDLQKVGYSTNPLEDGSLSSSIRRSSVSGPGRAGMTSAQRASSSSPNPMKKSTPAGPAISSRR